MTYPCISDSNDKYWRARMSYWIFGCLVLNSAISPAFSFGQISPAVYWQAPNHTSGYLADTNYLDESGRERGSLTADRFSLSQDYSITQIAFYGFYGLTGSSGDPDPPAMESFRIRLYTPQSSWPPLLPPNAIWAEAVITDQSRVLTSALVSGRREYRYVADLSTPFRIDAGAPYWLEIVQLGASQSTWRWESSTGGERASQSPIGSAWSLSSGGTAYELRIPEPATLLMYLFAVVAATRRRAMAGMSKIASNEA